MVLNRYGFTQLEADRRYDQLGAAAAVGTSLVAHTGNTTNPHGVTAAQTGALTQAQADARYDSLGAAASVATSLGTSIGSEAAARAAADATKANTVHSHAESDVTNLTADLAAKASALYVQSRGTGLVTNGTGLLASNYNFSGFTFDTTDVAAGIGSFKKNVSMGTIYSDEYLPVNPLSTYTMTGYCKAGDTGGGNFNAANQQYSGIAEYDADGLQVFASNYARYPSSVDTTLASQLNPGDTVVHLASATGWCNAGAVYQRQFTWWPYTNAKGYTWPNFTYSRKGSGNNTWASGGISGNNITLTTPWAGPVLPAGTPVRNCPDGSTFKYIAAIGANVPNAWTKYSGTVSPYDNSGNYSSNQFAPGTCYVKLVFLVNYHGAADTNVRWGGIDFK